MTGTTAPHRAAVLGHPIAHSLSPAVHRAAYAHLGLPWTYSAIDCPVEKLAAVLHQQEGFAGWSLTMPLKEAALALVNDVAPSAQLMQAVNTILVTDRGLVGHNTDVTGLVTVLREAGAEGAPQAAVLGAGATARSGLAAMARCRVGAVTVYARRPSAADQLEALAKTLRIDCRVAPWEGRSAVVAAPLVLSTVPTPAADGLAEEVGAWGTPAGLLVDVGYQPWPTALTQAWSAQGGRALGGLDLLVHQAVEQVLLMTGAAVPAAVLRDAAIAELAVRDRIR